MAPTLLYDYGDGTSIVPIRVPLLTSEDPLAEEASWEVGRETFEVERSFKQADRDTWQVLVRDNFGRRRRYWVDKQSPLAVAVDQQVFMNMGTEYELKLRLVGTEKLSDQQLAAETSTFSALGGLLDKLKRKPQNERPAWNEKQIALLKGDLPAVIEKSQSELLSGVVKAAGQDLEVQSQRAGDVEELAEQYTGKQVEPFTAGQLSGGEFSSADNLPGKVTVLHFWDYRDSPLEEPYGQVGYLDFLYGKRKEAGMQLYGVAVDGRIKDENTRGAAIRSVRKLQKFMNLSYPILLDDGTLVKKFGDPRLVGAEFPLFVVIGPDGKILHYHVGHYKVERDRGLAELDAVISEALKK